MLGPPLQNIVLFRESDVMDPGGKSCRVLPVCSKQSTTGPDGGDLLSPPVHLLPWLPPVVASGASKLAIQNGGNCVLMGSKTLIRNLLCLVFIGSRVC